jgi:DNA-binding response OmpR family regulator
MTSLAGKRILIVEDEMMLALTLEDHLLQAGVIAIGPAMRLETAIALAKAEPLDAAILDINIDGGRSYPVADVLLSRSIPFVFATGYGHVESRSDLECIPTITKPYLFAAIRDALANVLRR